MRTHVLAAIIVSSLLTTAPALAARYHVENNHQENSIEQNQQKLKIVEELYEGFFNRHDISVAKKLIAEDYKQHNPFVGDGLTPFLDFFSQHFKDNPKYRAQIFRSAVNGDLVFVHVKYQDNPDDRGTASVDIYRVNNQGKITEHWDVNQQVPDASANNNTMF